MWPPIAALTPTGLSGTTDASEIASSCALCVAWHQCFGSMGHRPHIRQCRPSLPWLHAVHARMRERVCVCIAHVWRASVCVCVRACMSCRALLRCRGSAHVCYKGFWMCGVYLALQSMTLPVDFAIKLVDENPTSLLSRDRFIAGLFY